MLSDSLRRMHFSDEESDRLIGLDEDEIAALARHLVPVVGRLIGDAQASEGELMREAGHRAGYAKGYARGCADMEEDYGL